MASGERVRILIDLQPLQTVAAATRGVGRYTNGLLRALASIHDVIGMWRCIETGHGLSTSRAEAVRSWVGVRLGMCRSTNVSEI